MATATISFADPSIFEGKQIKAQGNWGGGGGGGGGTLIFLHA